MDALSRTADRLSSGCSRPVSAAVADVDSGGGFPPGDERTAVSRGARRVSEGWPARVLLQHPRVVCAERRPREVERHLGLGSSPRIGRYAFRVLSRYARANRGATDEGRPLSARALRDPGECRVWRGGACGRAGQAPVVAIAIRGRRGRTAWRRASRRDPRYLPPWARSALRPGHHALPRLLARSPHSARVGTSEHAREVLRDHEGDGAQSRESGACRAAAWAEVGTQGSSHRFMARAGAMSERPERGPSPPAAIPKTIPGSHVSVAVVPR